MTSPRGRESPDLVVILLDCVRATSFPGTGGPLPEAGTCFRSIMDEATIFAEASTVAPWTLPSHASLFTGRYPWEHGVMGEGRLQLQASIPTVAGLLRKEGYRTLALSANGLVSPLLSSPESFETYRCAEWWEKTLRWIEPEMLGKSVSTRPRGGRAAISIAARGTVFRRSLVGHDVFLQSLQAAPSLQRAIRDARPEEVALGRRMEMVLWSAIDGSNRLARVLLRPGDPSPLPIAPWIEPTLESWLLAQSDKQPVHVFINLLDAHEKYLSDARVLPNLLEWLRYLQIPQNARLWLTGEWRPSLKDLELLRRLYESTLGILARRVEAIVEILRRTGRWNNTLLVITSDHGQAFGECNEIFHERSPRESLLHVPLWIRWPYGAARGKIRSERVSLIDVAPTLLEAAGVKAPNSLPGVSLRSSPLPIRTTAVYAMADGFPSIQHFQGGLDEIVLRRLRTTYAVGFSGGFKAIVGVEDSTAQVFDLLHDPAEERDLGSQTDGDGARAEAFAREAARYIAQAGRGTVDPDVNERLHSWGYL